MIRRQDTDTPVPSDAENRRERRFPGVPDRLPGVTERAQGVGDRSLLLCLSIVLACSLYYPSTVALADQTSVPPSTSLTHGSQESATTTSAASAAPSPASAAPPPSAAPQRSATAGASAAAWSSHPNPARAAAPPSSCLTCHGQLEGAQGEPVRAWATDVHAAAGLGCESCHGGDPSPQYKEDPGEAMNPARGFAAPPGRLHVADFCARCHADGSFMKQYNPQARIDQLAEYRTSVHGRLNAKGDPVPATCIDCHGFHGILPVTAPASPVYATNVPATCARCHSDAKRMAPYGIRTDQYADYRRSVHAEALLDRGDTAAPACNDCHGNHGATPPGVQSVANVCGQCHGREAALFGASIKKTLFNDLNVAECTVCHDHHRIRHPTPELFHGKSAPQVTSGKITGNDPFAAELGDVETGQKVTAVWYLGMRPHITADDARLVHRVQITAGAMPPMVLDATVRPGEPLLKGEPRQASSGNLTASLAIESLPALPLEPGDALRLRLDVEAGPGSAVHGVTIKDLPGDGLDPHKGSACLACHNPGDSCDQATERMYGALSDLERDLRGAAALLRKAEVAGMEVSAPLFELKSKGTTAAVESRALIHSFDPDRLIARTHEGQVVAASAKNAGLAALEEIQFRRKGLAVSLLLVGMVLLGIVLKIRQVDREKAST